MGIGEVEGEEGSPGSSGSIQRRRGENPEAALTQRLLFLLFYSAQGERVRLCFGVKSEREGDGEGKGKDRSA